jgi:hypothetical protein
MQRLTATIQQVVKGLNYTLKIIKNNAVKIITNKLEYHKTIDIQKERKVEFHTQILPAALWPRRRLSL